MKVVGLTGGIGSGKSTIARLFSALGIAVYDSDTEAKKLINTSAEIKKRIVEVFGAEAYAEGVYNRAYMADIVFRNPDKLAVLNSIVHPVLADHFNQWVALQTLPYVIKEAAILFESGSYKNCDFIITVTAPETLRISRCMSRDGSTEAQVRARMAQQWTDAQRIAFSDAVIENINLEETEKRVRELNNLFIKNQK
jgi:dephospho-coA kinase